MNETQLNTDDTLAGEYVLGTLSGEERRRFAERLKHESLLQKKVIWWENHFSKWLDELPPVIPETSVFETISSRIVETKSAILTHLLPWKMYALAASLSIIVLTANTFKSYIFEGKHPNLVSVIQDEHKLPVWLIQLNPNKQLLKIKRIGDHAKIANTTLELWMLPSSQKPISLGLIPDPNNEREVTYRLDYKKMKQLLHTQMLAISQEPMGGSPTGQPTGPVLYVAPIVTDTQI